MPKLLSIRMQYGDGDMTLELDDDGEVRYTDEDLLQVVTDDESIWHFERSNMVFTCLTEITQEAMDQRKAVRLGTTMMPSEGPPKPTDSLASTLPHPQGR